MQLSLSSPRTSALAAIVNLGDGDRYVHWGFIQMSVPISS